MAKSLSKSLPTENFGLFQRKCRFEEMFMRKVYGLTGPTAKIILEVWKRLLGKRPSKEKILCGGELVEALVVEEVGLPVFFRKLQEKKVRVMVDRAPGEEDFEVRQKEEFPQKLISKLFGQEANPESV
jgi:hypothetical protein